MPERTLMDRVDPNTGYTVFPHNPKVLAWAKAAHATASRLDLAPDRCGNTWHVGVDALPNAKDGSIGGAALSGPWSLEWRDWHHAQISVIYPGYPRQDESESDAAHRFRVVRRAAHMDGLLPEGPAKRRHLREPHAFILGLPLNDVRNSPLVVWEGSHLIMKQAMEDALKGVAPNDIGDQDLTEAYQNARRTVFDHCAEVPIDMGPGQAVLLDRHLIHGVMPWEGPEVIPRMVAYFRPQLNDPALWLSGDFLI